MATIKKLTFNFAQYNDGSEAGETFEVFEVDKISSINQRNCKSIEEGEDPDGKKFFVATFNGGDFIKVYNPCMVFYSA